MSVSTDQPPVATTEDPTAGVAPPPTPLLRPRDGLPPVVDSPTALAALVDAFAAGRGPVAVDAERASGYRYSQRAYLVQLRRAGAGTALIDPIACPDLSALNAVIAAQEWILHAASQDLACLAEVGLVPEAVFDTELAGRLLGYDRVGLGPMVEAKLGIKLEKGHSAADWSTRPLPESWLVYAALDVELLVALRELLADELAAAGKAEWATQEFTYVRVHAAEPRAQRADPWRRTSGIHKVHQARQLAIVRELWNERDALARQRDVAPGRVLPDAAVVAVAMHPPDSRDELAAVRGFGGRRSRRDLTRWWQTLERARQLPDRDLPGQPHRGDGPPPPRTWERQRPEAAARLRRCRSAVTELAAEHHLPAENLISPDLVRRLAWAPPDGSGALESAVAQRLAEGGARGWQVELVAGPLAASLPAARGSGAQQPGSDGQSSEG